MSVSMPLATPRMSVAAADDPYKRYWWLLLAGFAATGVWLCLPIMGTPIGAIRIDTSKPAVDPNAAQSLDSVDNPSGAPGAALDAAGKAAQRKKETDQQFASMLYQPPPEPGMAPGTPVAAGGKANGAGASNLAQQLKDVAKSGDNGGWNEAPRGGFEAPHLSGGGLSGLGSASGGSGASASVVSAFGSNVARVSFGSTQGLHDDGSAEKASAGGMQALRNAANASQAAAAMRSGDAARGGMSGVFDGARGKGGAIGAPSGGALAGAYAALDAAPANLKVNNPKLDAKTFKEPPAKDEPEAADKSDSNMGQQLAMMAASALLGGLVGGEAGQMIMSVGMEAVKHQQEVQAEARTKASEEKLKKKHFGDS